MPEPNEKSGILFRQLLSIILLFEKACYLQVNQNKVRRPQPNPAILNLHLLLATGLFVIQCCSAPICEPAQQSSILSSHHAEL